MNEIEPIYLIKDNTITRMKTWNGITIEPDPKYIPVKLIVSHPPNVGLSQLRNHK